MLLVITIDMLRTNESYWHPQANQIMTGVTWTPCLATGTRSELNRYLLLHCLVPSCLLYISPIEPIVSTVATDVLPVSSIHFYRK